MKTWKIDARSEGMEVHYTSMPARYEGLREYLPVKYPERDITVIYEAGFKGCRGNIRSWLIQCSWMCIKRGPAMLEAYQRISKNAASKKKTIVALARKLVARIHSSMR